MSNPNINNIMCSQECLDAQAVADKYGINFDCSCVDIEVEDLEKLFGDPAGCEFAKLVASRLGVEIICPADKPQ